MKSILMSIKSIPVCNIANGHKTYEIRKKFPKDFRGWIYIYCTKAKPYMVKIGKDVVFNETAKQDKISVEPHVEIGGKIIGKFYVNDVQDIYLNTNKNRYETNTLDYNVLTDLACISIAQIHDYLDKTKKGLAIHISKLEIFDKPKTLANFNLIRAPQSWQYIYE